MRVLICGSLGQLGSECVRVFSEDCTVFSVDKDELDITNERAVDRYMSETVPDLVINCAAHTQVDQCEKEPEFARAINAGAPGFIAKSASKVRARLLHVSTDYVFDGFKPVPERYKEYDKTNPLSVYGNTKRDGEQAVLTCCSDAVVVRTAWLYGATGGNFLKTMLALALASPDRTLRVVNDQWGAPTEAHALALQLRMIAEKGGTGIYHAVCEGSCTWFTLARTFLNMMGIDHEIEPISTKEFPTPARRPTNSVLESFRLKQEGIYQIGSWETVLRQFVRLHKLSLMGETKRNIKK